MLTFSGGGRALARVGGALFVAFVVLAGGGVAVPSPAFAQAVQAAKASVRTYAIPAGPLDTALPLLGKQSGLRLSFDKSVTAGKTTRGLSGSHTPHDALTTLLSGTGLSFHVAENGVVVLGPAAASVETLPTLNVDATNTRPDVREVSTEVIQRTQAKTLAEVFVNEPSVVVSGGGRNAQRLYLRGIESSNLNITIDGARQGGNLHQHKSGLSTLDPELLKRVEVQTGPGADRGPGALGGAISMETVDAQDLLAPGKEVGATVRTGYASSDQSWSGGSTVYGMLSENSGLYAHFSATDKRDYKTGSGATAPNTAGEDLDYFAKYSLLDLDGHSLRVSAERKSDSGLYVWGSNGSDMGFSNTPPVYVFTTRESYTLDHRYAPGNPWIDMKMNVYYNADTVENRDGGSRYSSDGVGGALRNVMAFNIGPTSHRLTVGTDVTSEDLRSVASGVIHAHNGSKNLALFAQNKMNIGPLGVSFGGRIDDYDATYGANELSGSRGSTNFGLEYELVKGLTAFSNYGEAVRASGIIPAGWMSNITSATKLNITKPELSKQIDGGLRYRTEGLFLEDDHLRLEGSVFDTRMKNSITATGGPGGVIGSVYNAGPYSSKGWEAKAGWGMPEFETTLGYTHVSTKDEFGNPVSVIRRLAASTGDRLVWDNRWQALDTLSLGYTFTYVARLTDVSGQPERPGYSLHAIQSEWRPSWTPGLTLNLVVNNLLDTSYCDQTTIYSSTGVVEEPGRDIRLGVSYKF
ncbi:TonB-dependent receptor [Humidesulfovibrio mexicanus]|uniref:TonB-dependent receptor n=1 Tax=Humidesulfovibrio mexicanus TaxID=147047 RepID=UPI0015C68051|nr:TonB-dependent receptor [Humidesulfovibrio mexicanus]